jgi:hypothetical protein
MTTNTRTGKAKADFPMANVLIWFRLARFIDSNSSCSGD